MGDPLTVFCPCKYLRFANQSVLSEPLGTVNSQSGGHARPPPRPLPHTPPPSPLPLGEPWFAIVPAAIIYAQQKSKYFSPLSLLYIEKRESQRNLFQHLFDTQIYGRYTFPKFYILRYYVVSIETANFLLL